MNLSKSICYIAFAVSMLACGTKEPESQTNFYKDSKDNHLLVVKESGFSCLVSRSDEGEYKPVNKHGLSNAKFRESLKVSGYWRIFAHNATGSVIGGLISFGILAPVGSVVGGLVDASTNESEDSSKWIVFWGGMLAERIVRGVRLDNIVSEDEYKIKSSRLRKIINNVNQVEQTGPACNAQNVVAKAKLILGEG